MDTYDMCNELGDRTENEDSVGVYESYNRQFFFLADGLGGHGYGKEASASVIEHGKMCVEKYRNEDMIHCIGSIFYEGNERLKEIQKNAGKEGSMRTTLVVCAVEGQQIWIAHIGDSRGYVFQKRKVRQRTIDHSVPQLLALSGEIKEEEIRRHPDRNRLLRCLGDDKEIPDFDVVGPFSIERGMAILLCSDGFWENITEKEMSKSLCRTRSSASWIKSMKKKIQKEKQDKDNYSAIAIRF